MSAHKVKSYDREDKKVVSKRKTKIVTMADHEKFCKFVLDHTLVHPKNVLELIVNKQRSADTYIILDLIMYNILVCGTNSKFQRVWCICDIKVHTDSSGPSLVDNSSVPYTIVLNAQALAQSNLHFINCFLDQDGWNGLQKGLGNCIVQTYSLLSVKWLYLSLLNDPSTMDDNFWEIHSIDVKSKFNAIPMRGHKILATGLVTKENQLKLNGDTNEDYIVISIFSMYELIDAYVQKMDVDDGDPTSRPVHWLLSLDGVQSSQKTSLENDVHLYMYLNAFYACAFPGEYSQLPENTHWAFYGDDNYSTADHFLHSVVKCFISEDILLAKFRPLCHGDGNGGNVTGIGSLSHNTGLARLLVIHDVSHSFDFLLNTRMLAVCGTSEEYALAADNVDRMLTIDHQWYTEKYKEEEGKPIPISHYPRKPYYWYDLRSMMMTLHNRIYLSNGTAYIRYGCMTEGPIDVVFDDIHLNTLFNTK